MKKVSRHSPLGRFFWSGHFPLKPAKLSGRKPQLRLHGERIKPARVPLPRGRSGGDFQTTPNGRPAQRVTRMRPGFFPR